MSQELSRALRFLPSLVSAPERLHKYTAKPIEEKHPLSKDTFSQSEKRKQILPKFNMEPKNDTVVSKFGISYSRVPLSGEPS